MTKNTVNETERMVVTRVFDAPRELVWKAWTDPKYVMRWWGPKGFTTPVCQMDFRVGGKSLFCMKTPDGQEFWNAVAYHEIVLHEKIVSDMYFSETARRNSPRLEMNPWRARKIAVNWRVGTRYSIKLLTFLRGWCRRSRND